MTTTIKVFYTSDVHGQLTSTDYATGKESMQGLSRMASYLQDVSEPYLLLDNGDMLQGTPLMTYHRKHAKTVENPAATVLNTMGYDYVNLGNHDFNFGQRYLKQYTDALKAKVLCANVLDDHHTPLFAPYTIHQFDQGIRVGIIGAVTHYIPHWEQPDHIKGLIFSDALKAVKATVSSIRDQVDALIVLYHGGFEKDLQTHETIGRPTDENQGYAMAHIDGVDALLCGHQHLPTIVKMPDGKVVLQAPAAGKGFGEVALSFKPHQNTWTLTSKTGRLVYMDRPPTAAIEAKLSKLSQLTSDWLDEPIGVTSTSMKIIDPLSARIQKHPMFQMVNQLQLDVSNAMISAASMPNDAPGFDGVITLRDVLANFVFPNILIVLEITGKQLLDALERTAEYFTSQQEIIKISDAFTYPKLEHYNYDVYDNITYTIDVSRPIGARVTELKYNQKAINLSDQFTLVLNNYRASGGGDYAMFTEAKVIREIDIDMAEMVETYIRKQHTLVVPLTHNYKII